MPKKAKARPKRKPQRTVREIEAHVRAELARAVPLALRGAARLARAGDEEARRALRRALEAVVASPPASVLAMDTAELLELVAIARGRK